MKDQIVRFNSVDGFHLEGSLRKPVGIIKSAVLMVHGITVDRDEDGFYADFASKLETIGVATLRFDLRAHGKSEGKFEELTLTGVMNDIESAVKVLQDHLNPNIPTSIMAASFGGGLSVYWASRHQKEIRTIVLLNPILDYARRMLFTKPYWDKDHLTLKGAQNLRKSGWLPHGSFKMGRGLINELLFIKPFEKISEITIPILTIHGDKDSMAPFDIAKKYTKANKKSEFVPIKGADHGFTNPDDEEFTHPNTIKFRSIVFEKVMNWIKENGR